MTATILVADYSALEIAIQGELCYRLFGDEQIVRMYEVQKTVDMHSNNAREVFGKWLRWEVPSSVSGRACKYAGRTVDAIPVEEFKDHPFGRICRDLIKAVWYGLAYGKGAYGFSTLIGADGKMIGEKLAGAMVEALLDAVPSMRKWFAWCETFVRKHHGIYSLDGRWCDLSAEMESDNEWEHRRAFRRAYNFPMQATGAGIIGSAMVLVNRCVELMSLGYRMMLQVHDELVLRGPLDNVTSAGELLRGCMTAATANGIALHTPLQVSVGHGANYFDAK